MEKIYRIKITEEYASDDEPIVLDWLISVDESVTEEKLNEIVEDATWAKSLLDEAYEFNEDAKTINELIESDEDIRENFEDFLTKRPYFKDFCIYSWNGLGWDDRLYEPMEFIMKNEGIKYKDAEFTTIENSCS